MDHKIIYDYSKLKGKVREVFGNNKNYANFLKISEAALYEKYNSESYFNQKQINISMIAFDENIGKAKEYFFKEKVKQNSIKK